MHLSLPVSEAFFERDTAFAVVVDIISFHGKRQSCAAKCGSFPAVISISPRLLLRKAIEFLVLKYSFCILRICTTVS